jgi:hypothetical protein
MAAVQLTFLYLPVISPGAELWKNFRIARTSGLAGHNAVLQHNS